MLMNDCLHRRQSLKIMCLVGWRVLIITRLNHFSKFDLNIRSRWYRQQVTLSTLSNISCQMQLITAKHNFFSINNCYSITVIIGKILIALFWILTLYKYENSLSDEARYHIYPILGRDRKSLLQIISSFIFSKSYHLTF
jgi:hypothetical protein